MAALEGTVKTPAGPVQKKTAVIVGGGLAAIIGIAYFRSKKQQQDAGASTAGGAAGSDAIDPQTGVPYSQEYQGGDAAGGVDPATGYPYGSAEDLSATQALSQYPGYQGYGGNFPTNPYPFSTGNPQSTQFVNNAQWAQYVEQFLQDNEGADPTTVAAAIGKYLTGQPMTSEQQSVVQSGIAIAGFPPVAGPNGNPPGFNTASPNPTPQPHPGSPPPADTVVIPHTAGMTISQAAAKLTHAGLKWKTAGAGYHKGHTRHVSFTSPHAGETVKKGTTVTLHLRG